MGASEDTEEPNAADAIIVVIAAAVAITIALVLKLIYHVALFLLKLVFDVANSIAAVFLASLRPDSTDHSARLNTDGSRTHGVGGSGIIGGSRGGYGGRVEVSKEDSTDNDADYGPTKIPMLKSPPVRDYILNTDGSIVNSVFDGASDKIRESQGHRGDVTAGAKEESMKKDSNSRPAKFPKRKKTLARLGYWSLNTDGSHTQGVRGGAGGIIRDHNGVPIVAFAFAFQPDDILVHELQAIREGLKLAAALNEVKQIQRPRCINVATDDKTGALRLLRPDFNGKFPKNPNVRAVVEEIREVREKLNCTTVMKHVASEYNEVADYLSRRCEGNRGKLILHPNEFPNEFPKEILKLIYAKNP